MGPRTLPGSNVNIRIRSWRPAMPSISGPRSTVASNFTATPFVSGATCSLLMVLSCLSFQGLANSRYAAESLAPHPPPHLLDHLLHAFEVADELVHRLHAGAAARGDTPAARRVQKLWAPALLRRHREDDRLGHLHLLLAPRDLVGA